ncbi:MULTISPECIES: Crp/Fnr family transcriptional regulator [Reichenbachiella]|uniref:Transcriptional regulator n=1 Tax=Reichenbachiella agariperforans TaxID=156994 RepID=A0A1M6TM52_REIAG|nr:MULTISPECIES: Crp/Fnr family transcriptional regulator [Reichenbachiella]MBU2915494.1 Crp/Fnr family transcriptional regulator [Reichenbachiella agariperforans]RJE71441.1 transcriptional regulator [Reichenbachiella sp. MSK19-1]SHK58014.1 transcriptional regulator [Reichenbachiella agariperforans]
MKNEPCKTCQNLDCIIKRNSYGEGIEDYLAQKHTIQCKKGQQFILEGAPVHGLYFVYNGKVKVAKTGFQGREQIVRFAKDGEIIGHRGFGIGQSYQINAVALEDTVLCNFTNDVLQDMLHKLPNLTYDFMMFYAEELNRSETKVRKFAQMTVREKVIDAFLYIYRKFGQSNDYLNIQLSRKEIADFAGTTDEQVIRVISSLKKENLLRASGKRLGIIDLDQLRKEISEHNFFLDS